MAHVLDRANTTVEHLRSGWRELRRRWPAADEDEAQYTPETEEDDDDSGNWMLFIWGALTALALWWLYLRPDQPERRRAAGAPALAGNSRRRALPQQNRAQAASQVTEADPDEPQSDDDLTAIWGIGPARAARLHEVGITTFEALAVADMEQLRDILAGVGVETQAMETWPEQASLAAKGEWSALEALQDRIRAERA